MHVRSFSLGRNRIRTWALAADRPLSPAAIAAWARKAFLDEVQGRQDTHINLAKACLLIALEEEAALETEILQSSGSEQWLDVLDSAAARDGSFAVAKR